MSDALFSQHPVDRLIREIIATRRPAQADETDQIVGRIANAPFDPQPDIPVLMQHRGLTYRGQTLGSRASSLTYHLVKRVIIEGQWALGTSSAEYVADLHEAARYADAQLVLYERRGGNMATIVARNRLSPSKLGPRALSWIMIVFSADRGTIVSGYQVSVSAPSNSPFAHSLRRLMRRGSEPGVEIGRAPQQGEDLGLEGREGREVEQACAR